MAKPRKLSTEEQVRAGADFIKKYRFEPNAFWEDVLRAELQQWQKEANDQVADYVRWKYRRATLIQQSDPKNYFTVRAMHGPGKTYWGAGTSLWFGTVFPMARIPILAPKFGQITTRFMFEINKIRNLAVPDFQRMTEVGNANVRWCGYKEWTLFGQTAKKAENLAGLHNDHQLVFCDEASGIPEALFPTIFGAVSTGIVQILILIGNPTKNTGTFYDSHCRPKVAKDFCRISIDLEKAPRVSRKWVRRMVDKYGVDSPIVKIRCFGEFAEIGENQLIAPEWIVNARDKGEEFEPDGSMPRLRVSVDVSDGGEDKSVLTVVQHLQSKRLLLKQKSYSWAAGTSATTGADEIERVFAQFGGVKGQDEIIIDSLGVGAGLYGVMVARGHRVIRYVGGSASADVKQWRNRRVQSYMVLRNELRDGLLVIAPNAIDADDVIKEDDDFSDPWDEFDAQLCSIRKNPNTDRVEDLVTKEQMKQDGVVSPDRADSLAMTYATQAPTITHLMSPDERQAQASAHVVQSKFFEDYAG